MKLAGVIVLFLGILVLIISGFSDSINNLLLGVGGILILIGLLLYVILNRFTER